MVLAWVRINNSSFILTKNWRGLDRPTRYCIHAMLILCELFNNNIFLMRIQKRSIHFYGERLKPNAPPPMGSSAEWWNRNILRAVTATSDQWDEKSRFMASNNHMKYTV